MAFFSLKDFLSIWHFKLIGLIGPMAVSEWVNALKFVYYCLVPFTLDQWHTCLEPYHSKFYEPFVPYLAKDGNLLNIQC
jgi:hypothetical protein